MSKKTIAISIPLLLIVILGFLFVFPSVFSRGSARQPLQYNHKVHVESAGMSCTDCHMYAEKLAAASIPKLDVCQTCHSEEPISQSPEELKLLTYMKEQEEIPWVRIYSIPDHVYFSHRRHVVRGKLDCAECHGKMAEQTTPVAVQFRPVTMDACMDCHKRMNAATDCLACHR